MQNLARLQYCKELNLVQPGLKRTKWAERFLSKRGVPKILEIISGVIREVNPTNSIQDSDIILSSFFYISPVRHYTTFLQASLLVYPEYGSVTYELRTDREFMSNIHRNPNPIHIVHNNYYESDQLDNSEGIGGAFSLPGNIYLSNSVQNLFFFKTNPITDHRRYKKFFDHLDEKLKE